MVGSSRLRITSKGVSVMETIQRRTITSDEWIGVDTFGYHDHLVVLPGPVMRTIVQFGMRLEKREESERVPGHGHQM